MSGTCRGCSNSIVTDSIECPKCNATYHPSCAKSTSVLSNGGFQRCCGVKKTFSYEDLRTLICEENTKMKTDISVNITTEVGKIQESIEAFRSSIENRISVVEGDNIIIKRQMSILEDKVKVNADRIDILADNTPANKEFILEEVEERIKRRNNIILFNVPESTQDNREARSAADAAFVTSLCTTLLTDSAPLSQSRIGKYSPALQKPRPLKIVFANSNSTDLTIKNFIKFKKANQQPQDLNLRNLIMARDRTPSQLAQHRTTREEFQSRTAKGENNIRLITRNGITKIVTTQLRQQSREENVPL